jgi:GT2 family glycosyltransferase
VTASGSPLEGEPVGADPGALAGEIRRRLGPVPGLADWPLVSIVVLNRDGAGLLRRMVKGLVESTDYPNLELILIDNGSSDDSLDFIRRVEAPFPISILANPHNESFSDACNQGAELASGELLLFLNNDIEPFEPDWLRELVACARASAAGAVAATLICLEREHRASFPHGYGVQHRGLAFREEEQMIHPVLHGWEADPLDGRLGQDTERAAVAAACMLVGRDAFERVGGFSHGYVYGAEDVDICLKLRAAGFAVLCSGRSVAIHHPVSTRRAAPFEEERARKLANRRLLWERWGPQLRREYELDRLERRALWAEGEDAFAGEDGAREARAEPAARAAVEALGFCLEVADPPVSGLEAAASALRRNGHRCLLLEGNRVEDPVRLNYDVAVHLRGGSRYIPRPAQLHVLWSVSHEAKLTATESSRYHLVLTGSEVLAQRLRGERLPREQVAVADGFLVATLGTPAGAERFADLLVGAVEVRGAEVGYRRTVGPGAKPSRLADALP